VNYSAVIEQDMRILAERRMAAVSLARGSTGLTMRPVAAQA
jgi:hypothetical protein